MKLAMIGTGKLGSALLTGITAQGVLKGAEIGILERSESKAAQMVERFGVRPLARQDLHEAERIVIAVQPLSFPDVAQWLREYDAAFISTMAGVKMDTIREQLESERVIRAMPNLAATIGYSQTALAATPDAQEAGDLEFASQIFASVGDTYTLPEYLFDAFTGMSASGLAYAAVFVEALSDGGVRMGLPRATASELARKLLVTTGTLLAERPHPAILKDEVSSPGGTTIAGIRALERSGFRSSVMDAVEAATLRGKELGRGEE